MDSTAITCSDCPFRGGCPVFGPNRPACAIGRRPVLAAHTGFMAGLTVVGAIAASLFG